MPKKRAPAQPPDSFVVNGATGRVTYRRRDDVVAASVGSRAAAEGAFELVAATRAGDDARPVYARTGIDETAVPTGRIFVRCSDGAEVDAKALAALGLSVASRPEYAPGSAWVMAADVASSLQALDALVALPHVASVEPELLRPKSKR